MKTCRLCGATKGADEFYRDSRYVDGLGSYCKPCRNADSKERYGQWKQQRHPQRDVPTTKKCRACGKRRLRDEFYAEPRNSDGLASFCKACTAAKNGARQRTPAGKESCRKASRKHQLKNIHGITHEQFEAMLAAQGGACAICPSKDAGGRWGTFHIDHDHETNEVRGPLCNPCNIGLGSFRDDGKLLLAAASYLQRRQKPRLVTNG